MTEHERVSLAKELREEAEALHAGDERAAFCRLIELLRLSAALTEELADMDATHREDFRLLVTAIRAAGGELRCKDVEGDISGLRVISFRDPDTQEYVLRLEGA